MPRRTRCIVPGMAYHITQRGVNRRETFSSDEDRETLLGLMAQNLADSEVRILGWCLMTNRLHLVAAGSAAVIPAQWGGKNAASYGARLVSGMVGYFGGQKFAGLTEVVGSTDVPNVRDYLRSRFPNALVLELVTGKDERVAGVMIQVPAQMQCPSGTSEVGRVW